MTSQKGIHGQFSTLPTYRKEEISRQRYRSPISNQLMKRKLNRTLMNEKSWRRLTNESVTEKSSTHAIENMNPSTSLEKSVNAISKIIYAIVTSINIQLLWHAILDTSVSYQQVQWQLYYSVSNQHKHHLSVERVYPCTTSGWKYQPDFLVGFSIETCQSKKFFEALRIHRLDPPYEFWVFVQRQTALSGPMSVRIDKTWHWEKVNNLGFNDGLHL